MRIRMADAVRRRMAHHARAAGAGRRVLLVRLVPAATLRPVPFNADADGEAIELGADPGRPPCLERRAATMVFVLCLSSLECTYDHVVEVRNTSTLISWHVANE
jgi:hypothetical protein